MFQNAAGRQFICSYQNAKLLYPFFLQKHSEWNESRHRCGYRYGNKRQICEDYYIKYKMKAQKRIDMWMNYLYRYLPTLTNMLVYTLLNLCFKCKPQNVIWVYCSVCAFVKPLYNKIKTYLSTNIFPILLYYIPEKGFSSVMHQTSWHTVID